MASCFQDVIQNHDLFKAQFIKQRVGEEILSKQTPSRIPLSAKLSIDKIVNKCLALYLKFLYAIAPHSVRGEIFIQTSIGERHKWLYDSFSLSRLLYKVGFQEITPMRFNCSRIVNFNNYLLDINADGSPYKGDSSLYIEAIK